MRGSPIVRLVLTAIFLALAGWPVWLLTRPAPEARAELPVAVPAAHGGEFRLVATASSPARLKITQLDRDVIDAAQPAATFEGRLTMDRAQPEDLVIACQWDDGANLRALRVEIFDGDTLLFDTTLWGREAIDDAITLPAL